MSNSSGDSTIDNILLGDRIKKKKLIRKEKSPVMSQPDLEDWIDELQTDLYKNKPYLLDSNAGPSQANKPSPTLEGAPSECEEVHFFDEDTYRFSVSPLPSPNPFIHWDVKEEELDYDWDAYEKCSEAEKRRMRKSTGKLAFVGMSSTCSDEEISWNMRYYENLPDSSCNLKALKYLDISSCTSLEVFPVELGNLESLAELYASELNISKLPESIGVIRSLTTLILADCGHLLYIAELPPNLKWISPEGCTEVERLPNLSDMRQLEELNLIGCSGLTEVQGLEDLSSIKTLHLGGCNSSMLEYIFTKRFFQLLRELH